MADIKRILKKKTWTGRELGIIELTNMAELFKQAQNGEPSKPLIESAALNLMFESLKGNPAQIQIVRGYLNIHDWLSVKYNIYLARAASLQLNYQVLLNKYTQARLAEDVIAYRDRLPYCVTQKQYDDMKAAAIERFCVDEESGKKLYADVLELITRATNYYLKQLRDFPNKANPLKAIRKKYINAPVKSKYILDNWNEVTNKGYLQLDDGRRDDQMSPEEWERITHPNGDTTRDFMTEPLKEEELEMLSGTANDIIDDKLDDISYASLAAGRINRPIAQWHTYEEVQEEVSKWDVIEADIGDFFPIGDYTDENVEEALKELKKTFPELVKAMLADIDKKCGTSYSTADIKELVESGIFYRELYELNAYGMKEEAEEDSNVFNRNIRAMINGIAIVRPSNDMGGKAHTIDKDTGYYREPSTSPSLVECSLEAYFTEAENYAVREEETEEARERLLDDLYFIKNYRYVLHRIGELYDIPSIEVFGPSEEEIEEIQHRIMSLNGLFAALYLQIKRSSFIYDVKPTLLTKLQENGEFDYPDGAERQKKKLQVIKDHFRAIEFEKLQLPEDTKEKIEDMLDNFKGFKTEYADEFYRLLYERKKEEGEEI